MEFNEKKLGMYFSMFKLPKHSDMVKDKKWKAPTGQYVYVMDFVGNKAIVQLSTDNPYNYYGEQK